jgi:putative oxidoreductase
MDTGLLAARLVLGSLMAAHGAQKLFGWFGGYGLAGTGRYFEQIGFRPGRRYAAAAGVAELVSGVLLIAGLLGPIGPALMLSVMIVAAVSVHWPHGLFAASNGIEVPLLYGTGAAALALTGFGRYSVDAALGYGASSSQAAVWAVLLAAVVGAVVNLSTRRQVAA